MTRPRAEAKQPRGQAEDNKGKAQEDRRRRKTDAKEIKYRQTRHKPLSRLTIHAHKSHTINAKPQTHTNHIRTIKPSKTPLKREIKPYSSAMHHKQSRGEDKRHGTHHKRTRADRWQVLNPRKPAHLRTSGHHETPPPKEHTTRHTRATFQKYV